MSQWPGVSVDEGWRGEWTAYEGSQEALIATGLFCLDWFPGQPGNGTTSALAVCELRGRGPERTFTGHGCIARPPKPPAAMP